LDNFKDEIINEITETMGNEEGEQKTKIEESVKNIIKEIKLVKINGIEKHFIERITKINGSKEDFIKGEIVNSVKNFIKAIEITKIVKEIKKTKITNIEKSVKNFITELDESETEMPVIEDINIIKIKESIKNVAFTEEITELKESKDDPIKLKTIIKKFVEIITKNEELTKDFIERMIKIVESEKNSDKWEIKIEELKKEFIKRIMIIEGNPNKWGIKIEKKQLWVDEDLIHLICTGIERTIYKDGIDIIASKIINSNNIVLLTSMGIFIFYLNKGLISLNYFYPIHNLKQSIKNISKMIGYLKYGKFINKYDGLIYGWVSYVKNNKDFLKYSAALLMFAIEVHDSELIDNVYNFTYFCKFTQVFDVKIHKITKIHKHTKYYAIFKFLILTIRVNRRYLS